MTDVNEKGDPADTAISIPPSMLQAIEPDDSVTLAGRKIIASQMKIVMERCEGAKEGADPEDLHEMRVAVRRIRTALRVLQSYFSEEAVSSFMPGLKQTGRALGEARDLDSFIIWLDRIQPKIDRKHSEALAAVRARYQTLRNQMNQSIHDEIDSTSYQSWVSDVCEFASSEPEPGVPLMRDEAPEILLRLLEYATGSVPDTDAASFARLHKLRIRCKWLRYFCEFFDGLYQGRLEDTIKQVKTLQSELGVVQDHTRDIIMLRDDLDSFRDLFGSTMKKSSLKALIDYFIRERKKARKRFAKHWRDFVSKRSRETIAVRIRNL